VAWKLHFQRQHVRDRLDAVVSLINTAAKEQIVRRADVAAALENCQKVLELPVDVAAPVTGTFTHMRVRSDCRASAASVHSE
jgi:hypothetical protein